MNTKIPFLNLDSQYLSLRDEILPKIDEVCRKSAFCLGECVEEFEKNFADYCGIKYCLGVNSGTSALHLALLALLQLLGELRTVGLNLYLLT